MTIHNLQLRLMGVALCLSVIFVLDTQQVTAVHQLWLPLTLALGAYLMTLSVMAITITVGTLAVLNMDLGASYWVYAIAYPSLGLLCGLITAFILWQRFRLRIAATHDARWADRQTRDQDRSDTPSPGDGDHFNQ